MTDIHIIAPANCVTGGVELCHQFVHTVNADQPGRAAIVYYPFDSYHEVPQPYRRYNNIQSVRLKEITAGDTVILPEVAGVLAGNFPANLLHFWWMSVDNFYLASGDYADEDLDKIRANTVKHFYQSDYARRFLEEQQLGPAHRLADYLADEYLEAINTPPTGPRQDLIAYNPAKGLGAAREIIRALKPQPPKVVAIKDLSRQQVLQVLAAAKVYIDFGPHPGKDRLPREAAALGCCVLTNRRGAANNTTDMPIPDEYKIDDTTPGFAWEAADKIRRLLDDYDQQRTRFDEYRRVIAAQPAQFSADVHALFPAKVTA